jgi:hypothetical protein
VKKVAALSAAAIRPYVSPMTLTDLAAAMFKFPPDSDAWKDFAADCRERLNVASLTSTAGVDAPTDFSEYWLSVAWGENVDYDVAGNRTMIR